MPWTVVLVCYTKQPPKMSVTKWKQLVFVLSAGVCLFVYIHLFVCLFSILLEKYFQWTHVQCKQKKEKDDGRRIEGVCVFCSLMTSQVKSRSVRVPSSVKFRLGYYSIDQTTKTMLPSFSPWSTAREEIRRYQLCIGDNYVNNSQIWWWPLLITYTHKCHCVY